MMTLQIYHIIGVLALFQSAFLTFTLSRSQQGHALCRRLFSALLAVFTLQIAYAFTHSLGMGQYFIPYFKWIFLAAQSGFLIGPLLYLYIRTVIRLDTGLGRRDWLHLIPALGFFLYFAVRLSGINAFNPWGSPLKMIYGIAILLHESVYLLLVLLLLIKNRIRPCALLLKNGLGMPAGFRLFMMTFIMVWQIKLQSFVVIDVWKLWRFCPYSESLYFLAMLLFVSALAVLAMHHPEWLYPPRRCQARSESREALESLKTQLHVYMIGNKPFKDAALTLPVLARQLDMPARQLSFIVNSAYKQHFCDFINSYRIAESQRLLKDKTEDYRVLEAAYEVGFNSKSAFNRAFKKHTGMTPTAFKRRHR